MRGFFLAATVAVLLSVSSLAGDLSGTGSARSVLRADAVPISNSSYDWSNMNPTGAPSTNLYNLAFVYDSDADRIVAYGGHSGLDFLSNQTWVYDFESNAWSNMAPETHPNATTLVRAAYDSCAQRTILFGGWIGPFENGTYSNETWAYDSRNNTWTDLRPETHPSARRNPGMDFDTQSGVTILFGGHTIDNKYSDDTWAYAAAANSWTDMAPDVRPVGRRSPGMVYDARADRVILFGGFDGTYGLNDTWAYDFESNTWTNLHPANPPSDRWGFGFAYDAYIDRSVLFGGTAGDTRTWAYDFANNSWSILDTEHSPPGNAFMGMAYDSQSARTIMFGGSTNETWALTTRPGAASAPGAFAIDPGNGYLNLSWEAPATDGLSPITGYRIYRALDPGGEALFSEVGLINVWTDTNVTNGETVYYQVSAVNGYGEGPRSREVAAAPDGTPPETSASLSGTRGNGDWYLGSVTVTLSTTDDNSGVASTSVRVDGGDWKPYTSPLWVVADGAHTVDFYSTDRAGNVEAPKTVGFHIDKTPPQTMVGLNGTVGDGYWFHSTVTAEITATDGTSGVASIRYRLDAADGGDWQTYSTPLEIADGRHVLEAYAVDTAGLTSTVVSKSFGVDTQPPYTTAQVSGPAGTDGWYVGPVTVTLEASDALGATTISYRIDGGSWTTYDGPFVLEAGVHTLEFYAVDTSGLQEPVHVQTISIDMEAPTATAFLPSPPALGWYTASVPVTIAASDDLSGVASIHYRIDGGEWRLYVGPFSIAGDGAHALEYYAVDSAGLQEPIHSQMIPIDVTPPTVSAAVTGPWSAGWYTDSVDVRFTASDDLSGLAAILFRVDGGPWQTYKMPFIIDSQGPHTLDFAAVDAAGNLGATQSFLFQIDSLAPETRASLQGTAGEDGWFVSRVQVSLIAMDGSSGVASMRYRIDGGAWLPYEGPVTIGEGRHTVAYYSTDGAGHAETAHSLAVNIDTTAPAIVGLPPTIRATSSRVVVSWAGSDSGSGLDRFEVSVDGGAYEPLGTAESVEFHLTDGPHTIVIRAFDHAGNAASSAVTVSVDTGVFSSSGPYGATPLLFVIGVAAVVGAVSVVLIRRRKRMG